MPREPQNIADSYDFTLVGAGKVPFKSYTSSIDPTNAAPNVYIQGSINVFKKITGTIANRCGRLLRGTINAALSPVLSSYEWNTSLGAIYPLRVQGGNLEFESNIADGATFVWYALATGITLPRYVFDSWWDSGAAKDRLLMVHGDSTMEMWSGGVGLLASATPPQAGTIETIDINTAGTSYDVGDTVAVAGGNGDAVLTVTSTGVSGAVTGIVITNPGTGYSTGMSVATSNINGGGGSGLLIDITAVQTTASITLSGTPTAAQDGFDSSGTIVINGHTYTYGFTSGKTMYGVSTDPSGEAVGSVVIQSLITYTTPQNAPNLRITGFPFAGYICDFLKVIGNRVHIGSYTSREIPISSSDSFLNYTVPSPRSSGDPELLILDNTAKGISASKGNAFISAGTKDWYEISYSSLTVDTVVSEVTAVDKLPTADLSAALAHEFIDTVGDNIVYLSQDQQVRSLGTWRNLTSPKIPSLSQAIFDEIAGETFISGFSVGQLRAVGDFIYLTAPIVGKMFFYQSREEVDEVGNVVAERLWHAPFVNGIAKIAVIAGIEFFHSNQNPQLYRLWNTGQFHDDSPSGPVPYTSRLNMSYLNNGTRLGMNFFNRLFYEGYMSENTQLYGEVAVELYGSKTLQQVDINSQANPATFFIANPNSLGDDSLGDNPLGIPINTLGIGQQSLPKFRAIRKVNPVNNFEYGLNVFSNNLDDQWEILCLGANVAINTAQQAGFLQA